MEINDKNPIRCYLLDHGYHTYTNGPCCHVPQLQGISNYKQLKSSPIYQDIKQSMNQGVWHQHCKECQSIEKFSNQISKRKLYLDQVTQNKDRENLKFLVIDSGRLCNLQCRTCGPNLSSSWIAEYNVLQPDSFPPTLNFFPASSFELDPDDIDSIDTLEILGGEPFFNLELDHRVAQIMAKGRPNLHVSLTTNGTIFPNLKKLPWIETHKNLTIIFSTDAVGLAAEFIRTGMSWTKFESNVKKIQELRKNRGGNLSYHLTHSVLNLFEIDKTLRWAKDIGLSKTDFLTIVTDPSYLSYSVLTDQERTTVCKQLINTEAKYLVPVLESTKFDKNDRIKFFSFMEHTKNYHRLDWQEYLPELANLMNTKS